MADNNRPPNKYDTEEGQKMRQEIIKKMTAPIVSANTEAFKASAEMDKKYGNLELDELIAVEQMVNGKYDDLIERSKWSVNVDQALQLEITMYEIDLQYLQSRIEE